MFVSYAQRLEDFHLDALFEGCESGCYVDVGGGHPIADNVSFHFYLKGWSGLIVEPQADLARLYANIRPRDRVVSALVGEAPGEIDFHVVDRLHGFSTTIREIAQGASAFGAGYQTIRMPVFALTPLLAQHGVQDVDFLKIDVEGAEAAVLKGIDWTKTRPKVICIEAVQPGNMAEAWHEWEPILLQAGYKFAYFDALNRFYVAQEHCELAARFPKSPTDWNVVPHFYEFGRAHEARHHPDHALASRLIKGFLASLPERDASEILTLLSRSAPNGVMETGDALRSLLHGSLNKIEIHAAPCSPPPFDDPTRAALGRIAAQYDGGMIVEED